MDSNIPGSGESLSTNLYQSCWLCCGLWCRVIAIAYTHIRRAGPDDLTGHFHNQDISPPSLQTASLNPFYPLKWETNFSVFLFPVWYGKKIYLMLKLGDARVPAKSFFFILLELSAVFDTVNHDVLLPTMTVFSLPIPCNPKIRGGELFQSFMATAANTNTCFGNH